MAKKSKQQKKKTPETSVKSSQPRMRQIIIETDGNNIRLAKNETAGNLELIALLSTVLTKLQTPPQQR